MYEYSALYYLGVRADLIVRLCKTNIESLEVLAAEKKNMFRSRVCSDCQAEKNKRSK